MRPALLALALLGCGPSGLGPVISTCPAGCLGPMTAEIAVDCAVWGANVGLAQVIADEAGIIPAAEFCEPIPVHVRALDSWDDGATLSETRFGEVFLSRRGIHLLHERLHLWDEAHAVFNPGHVGWKENGYAAADSRFRSESAKFVPFEAP